MSTQRADSPPVTTGICVRCLHDADVEIGDVWLCLDCYHVAGSTCSGIGTLAKPVLPTC